MEYPIFNLPVVGGSLLIASVAILHVFIAMFSVGSGVFLALAERRARLDGDTEVIGFLKKYSRAVLLVPYVAGTIGGVGIWFVTSVVNPRAISTMIHLFVWGWACEWVMFLVDVTAIYLYFYTWDRIRPAAHNAIAWVFVSSSVMTVVLINGILSFMLTPGDWRPLEGGGFWSAFFNPSFWPTTLERLLVCLALAGAGAIAILALSRSVSLPASRKMTRLAYRMMMPCLLCLPLSAWAFGVIPPRAQAFLEGSGVPMGMFFAMGLTCFLILAGTSAVAMLRREYGPSILGAGLLCLFAFVAYASFEFVREGIRKPYVIEGFMYATGVTVPQQAGLDDRANLNRLRQRGVLSGAPWALPAGKTAGELSPLERGGAIYAAACGACHQPHQGYNALQPVVRGWTWIQIRRYLDTMHDQRPMMPPFPGTEADANDLTVYVYTLTERGGG
jgi:cytochrome bd-type quinol oxidase subunit 1